MMEFQIQIITKMLLKCCSVIQTFAPVTSSLQGALTLFKICSYNFPADGTRKPLILFNLMRFVCLCVSESRQEKLQFQLTSINVIYTKDGLMGFHKHSALVHCMSWKLSFKLNVISFPQSSLLRSLKATVSQAHGFIFKL